ncbi:MAG: chloride channel protein [Flavobacteriia bacterium]|nr:chloride channel protein [Flavobacteriia bacterium]
MTTRPDNWLGKFLVWRIKHIPQRQFIIMLSIVVGLITGFVAVILKNSTHFLQELVTGERLRDYHQVYYFLFPIIGILITVLIKRAFSGSVGEGIPSTLYAISRRNGILKSYRMYASLITSAFTVGLGGSVGLEGPTVSTGSAIGSNLGRVMHLTYKQRILLISCATAGAIASIFNAPIAAIIFTIEIFSLDLTLASLVPLLLASVSGAVTSIFLQGDSKIEVISADVVAAFDVAHIPAYVGVAVVCSMISIYFKRAFFITERFFNKLKNSYLKVLVGGTVLGLLIFLIPPLYGEGYGTINHLLEGNLDNVLSRSFLWSGDESFPVLLGLLAGLFLFKVIAASLTMNAGGVGGIFAPTLFMGAAVGLFFAKVINYTGLAKLPESNFVLVAMAGLMAGVLHSPLTAIFMIAEITGGYDLFLPLMLVSATAYLVTRGIDPHSIYTEQLARRGDLITHNKDRTILTLMKTEQVIETDFIETNPDMKLRDLVKVFTKSRRNLFPVLEDGELVGVLTLDDFKAMLFDKTLYDKVFVRDLMTNPPAVVDKQETMDAVMHKFQTTGAWNLPVVHQGKYRGFISKSKLFSAYRRKLLEVSD